MRRGGTESNRRAGRRTPATLAGTARPNARVGGSEQHHPTDEPAAPGPRRNGNSGVAPPGRRFGARKRADYSSPRRGGGARRATQAARQPEVAVPLHGLPRVEDAVDRTLRLPPTVAAAGPAAPR